MLDGLRENDWLPSSLRRDMRRIEAAVHQLEQQNGRHPTGKELAESLGLPLSDYQHMLQEARGYQLVYFEDFSGEGEDDYLERHITLEGNDPLTLLLEGNMRDVLIKAIDDLPDREKTVMGLYYEQDMNPVSYTHLDVYKRQVHAVSLLDEAHHARLEAGITELQRRADLLAIHSVGDARSLTPMIR